MHNGDILELLTCPKSIQFQRLSRGDGQPKPGNPPSLPAPVPTPTVPQNYQKQGITQSHSFSSSAGPPMVEQRKPATMNFSKPVSITFLSLPTNKLI